MSSRNGIMGRRPGLIFIFAPCPFAHQCSDSTPFEKKIHPNLRGGLASFRAVIRFPVSSARSGKDSSQGNVKAHPAAPRRKLRRLTEGADRVGCELVIFVPFEIKLPNDMLWEEADLARAPFLSGSRSRIARNLIPKQVLRLLER